MMNGLYGGMGVGAWIVMAVFWVALIALIVWLVANLLGRTDSGGAVTRDLTERPQEILDRRLASGEIDTDTYDALSSKLRAAHAARG